MNIEDDKEMRDKREHERIFKRETQQGTKASFKIISNDGLISLRTS